MDNYVINYANTAAQPLVTLTVTENDISNPYSSSLNDMKSPIGFYACVQGYQTLTGEWEVY